jgi:hypothetical protein
VLIVGASGWHYVTEYDGDLQAALDRLRRRVLDSGDYYWPSELGRPTALEELTEGIPHDGTHSVLDVTEVLEPDNGDEWGTLRLLSTEERIDLFGTAEPTRADFDRSVGRLSDIHPRLMWGGYAVVLSDGGAAGHLGIWGVSGD